MSEDREAVDQHFREMVVQHETGLLRLCFGVLRDRMLAEDAVQNTFEKAYRKMDTIRPELNEKAWLYQIAMNCCRDLRRSAWFRHVDRSVTPEIVPEPTEEPPSDEALAIHQAVQALGAKQRQVVLLYYVQQFSVVEIAEILGISQSSVSGRLERARRQLRILLTDEEGW